MATASLNFAGSTQPLGLANIGDLTETISNLKIVYHKYYENWTVNHAVMPMFYNVRNEGGGNGTIFTVSEPIIGTGVAHRTDENAEPFSGDISAGYSKNITVAERTYALALTWMFSHHNKYPEQEQNIIRGAAEACAIRMEYDMAAPFTYCTSTAYTDIDGVSVSVSSGDGLSFANASHTVTNSATTYRNRISTDPQISRGAIELAENLFLQQMIDNNGNRVVVRPDTIVTASDRTTYNTAMAIMRSTAPLDAPNAGVYNPQQGAYRVVMAPSIDSTFTVGGKSFTFDSTKQKQWMLVDSTNKGLFMVVTQAPTVMAPTVSNGGVQFLTGQMTWKAHAVYEIAALDPRFAVISVVTTS